MSEKTIKLIKKFIRYSEGSAYDMKKTIKQVKSMNWIERSSELNRMREILENAV